MNLLEVPVRWWHCPACHMRDRTRKPEVHTQFHNCPATLGIAVPLVEVSGPNALADARHVLVKPEDYTGASAVRTERGDGSNDVTVLAPTACVKGFA